MTIISLWCNCERQYLLKC